MRSSNLFFSAIHFFVTFLVLGIGAIFLTLPHADTFRVTLIDLLLNPGKGCTAIGGSMVGFGLLLFAILYLVNRGCYLHLEMGGGKVDIEAGAIRACAWSYFQENFPDEGLITEVVVRGKSIIEIIASLPKQRGEDFFERVEEELGAVLARHFGYQKPFTLTFVETV